MAAAVLALPGHDGAIAVRACAAAGFALLVFVVSRAVAIGDAALHEPSPCGDRGASGSARKEPPPLPSLASDGEPAPRAKAMVAGVAAIGAALTIAIGLAVDGPSTLFFALGIAGFLIASMALVGWAKAHERRAVRTRARGGEVQPGVTASDVAALALMAIGLATCFAVRFTPVSDIAPCAAATGIAVFGVLAACSLWLFHTPKVNSFLSQLHEQLESESQQKELAQTELEQLGESYSTLKKQHDRLDEHHARLKAQHENDKEQNRKLAIEIAQLIESKPKFPPTGIEEGCDSIAAAYDLSKREHDVLLCLARGWSRQHIADELQIRVATVSSHVARLYRKLEVHSNQELMDFVDDYRVQLGQEKGNNKKGKKGASAS